MNVTFFGHRDASSSILQALEQVLLSIIESDHRAHFYIGNQGNFDRFARQTLCKLSSSYPHIKITIVIAYMPTARESKDSLYGFDTLFPDGLESTPPRYAISKRNEWMLHHSDMIITHVISPAGGAARFKEIAEKMGKPVINIT